MEKQNKVVFFAESPWQEEYNSGVGRAMEVDRKGLEERGWKVCAVFPKSNKPVGENEFRIDSIRTSLSADPYYLAIIPELAPAEYKRLLEWLKEINPDILYLQGTHSVTDYGYRAGKELGIPVVVRIHTFDKYYIWTAGQNLLHLPLIPLKATLSYLQTKRSTRITMGADLSFFPTEWYFERYCQDTGHDLGHSRSIVLPNLVPEVEIATPSQLDEMHYSLIGRRSSSAKDNFPLILSGVRVTSVKNLEFLIFMMAEIEKLLADSAWPFIHPWLVFTGKCDPKYVLKMKRIAKEKGIERWINFTDELSHELAMTAMQCARIAPIPSFSETRCFVFDEARLCRTLPLVMEGTAMAESADPAQILPDNPKTWAEYILKLLSDVDAYQSLVESGYDRARQQAIPEIYFNRLEAYFESLIKLKN